MVNHLFLKSILREIRCSLGRFIAILVITTLGIGFFSGLRSTEPAMTKTGSDYIQKLNLYDFRILSTLGFDDESLQKFSQVEGAVCEGSYNTDAIIHCSNSSNETTVRFHSITEKMNFLELKEGRMPNRDGECVIDFKLRNSFNIGDIITISNSNTDKTVGEFAVREFEVVGYANSVLYLNFERGSTGIGNGSVAGFVYIPYDAFSTSYYNEVYIDADISAPAYSDEYKTRAEDLRNVVEKAAEEGARDRYDRLKLYAESAGIQANAAQQIPNIKKPQIYLLGREDNVGYASFENDSTIVSAISVVFPMLFLLVAILVCMTTMTRMVDEKRMEIGTMKSLGYSDSGIHGRFLAYSGTAAVLGCLIGFFLGSIYVPKIIWSVYNVMYDFAELEYFFSPGLFILCFAVAIGCACGSAYFACRKKLCLSAAQLMRPESPKNGKQTLLEKFSPLWKRLNFLQKVAARNIFRYKNRFIMMIIGIGGCTALLVTGFGIRDSVSNVVKYQFEEITKYDFAVSVNDDFDQDSFNNSDFVSESVMLYQTSVDLYNDETSVGAYLISSEDEHIYDFFDTHNGKKTVLYPESGHVTVSKEVAELMGIKEGDEITLRFSDMEEKKFKVAGIFDNYIYNYVMVSPDDISEYINYNMIYANTYTGMDIHEATAKISNTVGVTNVSVSQDITERVGNSLKSVDSIVWFVLICAVALEFVVIYNLSNINIAERVREIATIKVLGFYKNEVVSYIFREIIVLTAIGGIIGLPLGKLLHTFVMSQIKTDSVNFANRISCFSYIIAIILTFVFAFVVNLFMIPRIDKIDMTCSLKSVE